MQNTYPKIESSFLKGGGEMGELTRNFAWYKTSIGAPDQWPQSLRTAVSFLLHSKFPMFLWWGEDLIQFYNDAYRPSLGKNGKHPKSLGQKGKDCWPEIWPTIKPLIDQVLFGGEATWSEDQLIPIYRNGKLEDVYWTFGYSPVTDDAGNVAGVMVTCTETTEKILNINKLIESREQLAFAVDAAELATWDLNPITNRFTANKRYAEWFGISAEEATENTLALDIIAEEDRQRVIDAYMSALDYLSNSNYDIEYTIRPKNKPERILRAKGKAWFNKDRIAYRFNGTLQDVTAQVTARKTLEESAQRIRSVIESVPFPIGIYTGKEMRIQFANKAILSAWGKGSDVIGKLYSEVLPELGNQQIFKQLEGVYTTGVPFNAKDQRVDLIVNDVLQPFYFNYSFTPLFDSSGKVYAVMNTAADITDLHLANKKIEESEANLRNIILQAPVAMCILRGSQFVVEIANKKMFEVWGKNEVDVLLKPLFDGLPEAKDQGFEQLLTKVYTTGETFTAHGLPAKLPRNNKIETVYLNFVYEAYRENNGIISGVMAVANDVTEQVVSQKQAALSEERARMAIESGDLGTYEITLETDEIKTSERFNAIWGVKHAITRFEFVACIHPDDRIVHEKAHKESESSGRVFYEARVVWDDHSIHWVRVKGKLIPEDDFISLVSHELKTPLTSLKGYSYILTDKFTKAQDEASITMLAKINNQVNRLNYIIQDLMDVTRLEGDKIRFREDDFNFNELVSQIIEEVQTTTRTHEILIDKNEPAQLYADEERTSQVLTNFLTNAIRYSPKANTVIVSSYIKNDEIVCSVKDFGNGITKDKQAKIFEKFYQASDVNRFNAGLGLGLYISAQIIKRQNGKIWVESEQGEGSTFYFTLPLKKKPF